MRTPADPELAAAVEFTRQMSRRRFLARSGVGLGAALLAPRFLTACSQPTDDFTFSNWVAYIDEDDSGDVRGPGTTIADFEKSTGITHQLPHRLQRQRRVLQPLVLADARSGQAHRRRHRRADLLDGGPPDRARLDREAAARPHPQPQEPRGRLHRPRRGTPGPRRSCRGRPASAASPTTRRSPGGSSRAPTTCSIPPFKGQIAMLTEMRDSVGLTMFAHGQRPGRRQARRGARGARQDRGGPQQRPDPQVHRQRVPPGSVPRRARRLRGVVGRHLLARVRPRHPLHRPRRGRHAVVRHHGRAEGRAAPGGRREVDELRVRPRERGPHHRVGAATSRR